MDIQMKEAEVGIIAQQKAPASPHICKGPMEGIVIVNGRPQTERVDMPTISFDSIEAIMRLTKDK